MIRRSDTFVYFIRPAGQRGPVKIGCSVKPAARLHACRAGSPVPLEMVAVMRGDLAVEWGFHARFSHLHLHYEWFSVDDELDLVIEQVRRGKFKASSLPPPQRLRYSCLGPKPRAPLSLAAA